MLARADSHATLAEDEAALRFGEKSKGVSHPHLRKWWFWGESAFPTVRLPIGLEPEEPLDFVRKCIVATLWTEKIRLVDIDAVFDLALEVHSGAFSCYEKRWIKLHADGSLLFTYSWLPKKFWHKSKFFDAVCESVREHLFGAYGGSTSGGPVEGAQSQLHPFLQLLDAGSVPWAIDGPWPTMPDAAAADL